MRSYDGQHINEKLYPDNLLRGQVQISHTLSRFPGPDWASMSRAWIERAVIRGNPHKNLGRCMQSMVKRTT